MSGRAKRKRVSRRHVAAVLGECPGCDADVAMRPIMVDELTDGKIIGVGLPTVGWVHDPDCPWLDDQRRGRT